MQHVSARGGRRLLRTVFQVPTLQPFPRIASANTAVASTTGFVFAQAARKGRAHRSRRVGEVVCAQAPGIGDPLPSREFAAAEHRVPVLHYAAFRQGHYGRLPDGVAFGGGEELHCVLWVEIAQARRVAAHIDVFAEANLGFNLVA